MLMLHRGPWIQQSLPHLGVYRRSTCFSAIIMGKVSLPCEGPVCLTAYSKQWFVGYSRFFFCYITSKSLNIMTAERKEIRKNMQ